MDETQTGLLPASARKAFQQSLAKCQACLDMQAYLDKLGHPDPETTDRANHVYALAKAALELDRQATVGK